VFTIISSDKNLNIKITFRINKNATVRGWNSGATRHVRPFAQLSIIFCFADLNMIRLRFDYVFDSIQYIGHLTD